MKTHLSPGLRRTVLASLVIAAAGLATATVLAHPAPVAASPAVSAGRSMARTEALSARLASAGDDTGPGYAESEVARLPPPSR